MMIINTRNYIEEANIVTDRYQSALACIANDRLGLALFQMEGKLKGPLHIIFGMGSQTITYRNCDVQFWLHDGTGRKWSLLWSPTNSASIPDDCWDTSENNLSQPTELDPLGKALNEINDILEGYSQGSPNDVEI